MLPRRTPAADPSTAARVRALLRADGWVPPTGLPQERGGVAEEVPSALPAGSDTDDEEEFGPSGGRHDRGPGRGSVAVPGPEPVADAVTERTPDPAYERQADSGPGPAGLPGAGLLDRWRGSRLDPGRRGVAALALVAVLAAAFAALVLLRGRPTTVPAPTVVSSGVPVPGSSAAATSPRQNGSGTSSMGPNTAGSAGSAGAPPAAGGVVVVSVVGKVAAPGLVRLPMGSRVDDAVRAAGGLLPGTDPAVLNGARRLVDGEQVLVGVPLPPGAQPAGAGPDPGTGTSGSSSGSGAGGTSGAGGDAIIDLNTATAAQLDALPGIGPVLAQRIVGWRTEHGRFGSVDQLREVDGIGESKYAELQSKVRV